MARPPKELDDNVVYAMAERGWSDSSIAAAFRCDIRTVRTRYQDELTQCRQAGKQKLLDLMYEMAFKGRDVQAAKYLCDRFFGPIERKTTITLEDAKRTIEVELRQRGVDVDHLLESVEGSAESES